MQTFVPINSYAFRNEECKNKYKFYPKMHRGVETKLHFIKKLYLQKKSLFMHSYQSASSTWFKNLDKSFVLCLQASKNCIAPNPKVKCIIQRVQSVQLSKWVWKSSGLTYFGLWNSTSTLIQAAKLVQWLASKGDKQAMAPENELQWKVYTILSSRGLVQSNITAKYYSRCFKHNMYDYKWY